MSDMLTNVLFNLIFFGFFVLIYYLLNRAEKTPTTLSGMVGAKTVYWLVALGYLLLLLGGLLLHFFAFIISSTSNIDIFTNIMTTQELPETLHKFGISLWLPSLLALLFFIPIIRKGIARVISIDPTSRIHTVTLALSMLIIIQMAITYAVGIDTLSSLETESNVWGLIANIWSQDIMFALIGFVGVGFLTKRTFSETLQRLGLIKPTYSQILIGIATAVGLVITITYLEYFLVQTNVGVDKNIQEYTEKLIGPLLTSIPGIFTLGFAAAIGEETIFRGALQPRFGILFTSLLFALVHANYGLSISTLIVFGLGLCLGFVRLRFNLTTAMIIHAIYNMSIGLLEYLQP